MSEPVLYAIDDRIARLSLNRPETLNSLNAATIEALDAGLDRALAERASALVLTGTGRAFCSGADLSSATEPRDGGGAIDLGAPMRSHFNPLMRRLDSLPIPVVIAVNGVAAGGGASLALAGDLVIAARSASFRQTFGQIGLIPDLGATWLMPRLAGLGRARGMALLGDAIPAETAHDWGLIWEVVDDAGLLPRAHALAIRLAALPAATLQATRQAFAASAFQSYEQQIELETELQARMGREPAFAEAVARFLARRRG